MKSLGRVPWGPATEVSIRPHNRRARSVAAIAVLLAASCSSATNPTTSPDQTRKADFVRYLERSSHGSSSWRPLHWPRRQDLASSAGKEGVLRRTADNWRVARRLPARPA